MDTYEEDCNDLDSDIYPSITEICNGVDNNYDSNIDRDAANYGVLDTYAAIDY